MTQRQYPELPETFATAMRPISFVVVHFSDDYFHNLLLSDCVRSPFNQLITIDNRNNLFFDNLTQAINAGLDRAGHELIAIVHEDVLLPRGWQERFEQSLAALERTEWYWELLGSVGWTKDHVAEGHWSDPHGYTNTLTDKTFAIVDHIDEQLMIVRRSRGMRLDRLLPSIHKIGRDQAAEFERRRLKTYAVNAPTIHKFADETGTRIAVTADSPKIQARTLPSYVADMACCDEYFYGKWPALRPEGYAEPDWSLGTVRPEVMGRLSQPIVLLSRGGSGSRLLSWLAQDAGIWLGNDVTGTGDTMEMVQAVYMGVLNGYQDRASWQKERVVPRIRLAAARMLERAPSLPDHWGFKLPESMLLVSQLDQAFSGARYLHLIRDPLTTCLRRTHMTARFDNVVGRVAIRAAYHYCGRDLVESLTDSPALRMAYTTIHQIETVRAFMGEHAGERYLEVRFEDLLHKPTEMPGQICEWLGSRFSGTSTLEREVDPGRAARPEAQYCYPAEIEETVATILAPLRRDLGYL